MSKVNHKQMYSLLKSQVKVLQNQLSPTVDQVNEIPPDFNQTGWDTTIVKVEQMLEGMKRLREVRGKRLTPQFYRTIYNRAIIANGEIGKMYETLTAEADDNIDFEAECIKLNAEIYDLNNKVAEAAAASGNSK